MSWLRPVEVCEPLNIITGYLAYYCCVIGLLVSSTPSSSVEAVTGQLSPAGIAAVFMGLGIFILAAVCITLVVYIVWNCITDTSNNEQAEVNYFSACTQC